MTTYHIGINGPAACRARTRPCPLGGVSGTENHFDSEEAAVAAHQKKLQTEHGLLKTSRKIDDPLLAPVTISTGNRAESVEDFTAYARQGILNSKDAREVSEFYATIKSGVIPPHFPYALTDRPGNYDNSLIVQRLSTNMQHCGYYAKVTKEMISGIKENIGDGVVLDPMMGNGFMVKGLREAGVKTIGSDNHSWEISEGFEKLDAMKSLKKYGNDITHLVISWAPPESDIDLRLLKECRKNFPHITIINIGEERGCTGSDEFWAEADEAQQDPWVEYQTLSCLYDKVTFIK